MKISQHRPWLPSLLSLLILRTFSSPAPCSDRRTLRCLVRTCLLLLRNWQTLLSSTSAAVCASRRTKCWPVSRHSPHRTCRPRSRAHSYHKPRLSPSLSVQPSTLFPAPPTFLPSQGRPRTTTPLFWSQHTPSCSRRNARPFRVFLLLMSLLTQAQP